MNNKYIFRPYWLIATIAFLIIVNGVSAQSEYQPYSFQFDQNYNQYLYSTKTREHTVLKPLLLGDSLIKSNYDSAVGNHKLYWTTGRFYNEHLINSRSSNSTFYADVLPDISRGLSLSGGQGSAINSLGLQLGGTVSSKFSYYASVYGNNETFPSYLSTYIQQTGIIPGQSYMGDSTGKNNYSWAYITALASYTPNKYLNISMGRDKNFIGDGYRSLLLSDYASPYLFFKLTATLGNLRFMSMWTYMNDPASTSPLGIDRKKFGVFHFIDWNVSNRMSIGLFENVIGYYTDDNGAKRSFDFYYLNPLIVMKPINNSSNDPDKSLLGLNFKYKLSSHLTYYFQFALNEFNSKDLFPNNGSYTNKYGYQLGFRGNELFNIKGLSYLVESNNVRPFTYSARSAIESYSANGEALSHPWGANFRELVGQFNYNHNRWNFSLEADYGKYGLDSSKFNFGRNIFKSYTTFTKEYGNDIGQGLSTKMVYVESKAAYILNPKYNLRLELGVLFRTDKNYDYDDKTSLLTIGLKSSFRNLYTDIVSYKTH